MEYREALNKITDWFSSYKDGNGMTVHERHITEEYKEAKKTLCKLIDKIENRTLVDLPCKVGETCYIIMGDKKIKEAVVINFSIEADGIYVKVRFKDGIFLYTSIAELNRTREQAETKLKKLQSEE